MYIYYINKSQIYSDRDTDSPQTKVCYKKQKIRIMFETKIKQYRYKLGLEKKRIVSKKEFGAP